MAVTKDPLGRVSTEGMLKKMQAMLIAGEHKYRAKRIHAEQSRTGRQEEVDRLTGSCDAICPRNSGLRRCITGRRQCNIPQQSDGRTTASMLLRLDQNSIDYRNTPVDRMDTCIIAVG